MKSPDTNMSQSAQPYPIPSDRKQCRALYVEDSRADQDILQEAIYLADVPVELVTASTANSALALLSAGKQFHVIILDWNLPAVSGAEFLTELRVSQPLVPVIILTGEPRTVDATVASKFGATNILKKPLALDDWEKLAARLYDHCGEAAPAAC